jgi:hypothetical protein
MSQRLHGKGHTLPLAVLPLRVAFECQYRLLQAVGRLSGTHVCLTRMVVHVSNYKVVFPPFRTAFPTLECLCQRCANGQVAARDDRRMCGVSDEEKQAWREACGPTYGGATRRQSEGIQRTYSSRTLSAASKACWAMSMKVSAPLLLPAPAELQCNAAKPASYLGWEAFESRSGVRLRMAPAVHGGVATHRRRSARTGRAWLYSMQHVAYSRRVTRPRRSWP